MISPRFKKKKLVVNGWTNCIWKAIRQSDATGNLTIKCIESTNPSFKVDVEFCIGAYEVKVMGDL